MNIYDKPDTELLSKVNKLVKDSKSFTSDWRKEAEEDFDFSAGKQWDSVDLQKLKDEKRPVLTFNRCNVIISAVLGMEANQRQELKFYPRNNQTIGLSEAIDDIAKWVRDYGDIGIEESQSFEDMLTCGMGWNETRMEYNEDLDGKILQESVNPLEMYWDTSARKRNLTDKQWVARVRRMSLDEIKEQWPDKETEMGLDSADVNNTSEAGSVSYFNKEDAYRHGETVTDETDRKGIEVIHFQWVETVPVFRVAHPQTGQVAEMSEEQFNQMKPVIETSQAQTIKQRKKHYYFAFCTKGTLLEKGELAMQKDFSYSCLTGKKDHTTRTWFGLIRLIKDPQRWANKFLSTFIDILDSNSKGGVMVEQGALLGTDVKEFENKWARADSVVWVNSGALSQDKIVPKPTATFPQSVDKLLEFAIASIHDVSGVNLELLGSLDRGDVGMVVDSRKRSAYTILAPFFDSLKKYRESNAILLMECIKKFMPEEKMAMIMKENLKPMISQVKQMDLNQVSVVISESPQSENNRYMTWLFISQTLPQLIQMGVPIPPEILEYSPLPQGLIESWKKMLATQQQKSSQMGDMQKQLDLAEKQGKIGLDQAKIQKTTAEAVQKNAETFLGRNVYGP